MNKQELRELIDSMDVYMPICNIEKELGMAKTTLQKALKYEDKKLPKKWVKPLINFCKKQEQNTELSRQKTEPIPQKFDPKINTPNTPAKINRMAGLKYTNGAL